MIGWLDGRRKEGAADLRRVLSEGWRLTASPPPALVPLALRAREEEKGGEPWGVGKSGGRNEKGRPEGREGETVLKGKAKAERERERKRGCERCVVGVVQTQKGRGGGRKTKGGGGVT